VPDHYKAAVRHLTALAREGGDFAEALTGIIAQVAGNLGSSYAVIAGRPGSWEAASIASLLASAVGGDGEYLPPPMDSKLTDAKARQIRDAALYGEMTQREIATEFDVSQSTVADIAAGRTWGWLASDDRF
jgi:hypothetical protein